MSDLEQCQLAGLYGHIFEKDGSNERIEVVDSISGHPNFVIPGYHYCYSGVATPEGVDSYANSTLKETCRSKG